MSQADKYLFANTSKISTRRGEDTSKISKSSNQSPINMSRKTSITPTKARETSPFNNKFYNRVYEKDEIKKVREENVIDQMKLIVQFKQLKQIQELAQTKKMSQNSYRILCKQLEEQLALEIQKLDMQESKKLTFEQIGRLLTVFNVIGTIQYNEQSECKKLKISLIFLQLFYLTIQQSGQSEHFLQPGIAYRQQER